MFSTGLSIAASLLLLTSPQLQLADPVALFPPIAESTDHPAYDAIQAARGESESIALWLRNDEQPRVLTSCTVYVDSSETLPSQCYIVREEADSHAPPLVPLGAATLAPNGLLHLILRITLPETAPAGLQTAQVALEFESGERVESRLAIDVFDFDMPRVASLPVLLGLDRTTLRGNCGLAEDLADWLPLYTLLAQARMGFQVWPVEPDASDLLYDFSEIDAIKAHLSAATGLPGVPAVEIGGQAGALLRNWPAPVLDSPQDPLQYLLFSIMADLDARGWVRPTVLIPNTLPPRDDWQQIRSSYARVGRADERVTRLLAAPAMPFFERYTDLWALPLHTPHFAMTALRNGESLIRYPRLDLAECTSSASIDDLTGSYPTEAGDAFDGSEVSAWRSAKPASSDAPAWLQCTLRDRMMVEKITVVWAGNEPGIPPTLETAYSLDSFSRASVDWESEYFATEGGLAASVGAIKYPRECQALRLLFSESAQVAEVLLNHDSRKSITNPIRPVSPWLDMRTDAAVWAAPEAAGIGARLLPWLCWRQGFEGILGPVITGDGKENASALIACTPEGTMPRTTLLHWADGLEDFEYLRAYAAALRRGDVSPPADFQPVFFVAPESLAQGETGLKALAFLREQRKEMGRLLSGHRSVTRNFGPRKK